MAPRHACRADSIERILPQDCAHVGGAIEHGSVQGGIVLRVLSLVGDPRSASARIDSYDSVPVVAHPEAHIRARRGRGPPGPARDPYVHDASRRTGDRAQSDERDRRPHGKGRSGHEARGHAIAASPRRGRDLVRASPIFSDQKDHELGANFTRSSWRGTPSLEGSRGWLGVDTTREPLSGDDGHASRGRDAGPRRLRGRRHRPQGHDLAAVRSPLAQRLQRGLAVSAARGCGAGVGRQEAERLAVEVPATGVQNPEENGEREDPVRCRGHARGSRRRVVDRYVGARCTVSRLSPAIPHRKARPRRGPAGCSRLGAGSSIGVDVACAFAAIAARRSGASSMTKTKSKKDKNAGPAGKIARKTLGLVVRVGDALEAAVAAASPAPVAPSTASSGPAASRPSAASPPPAASLAPASPSGPPGARPTENAAAHRVTSR